MRIVLTGNRLMMGPFLEIWRRDFEVHYIPHEVKLEAGAMDEPQPPGTVYVYGLDEAHKGGLHKGLIYARAHGGLMAVVVEREDAELWHLVHDGFVAVLSTDTPKIQARLTMLRAAELAGGEGRTWEDEREQPAATIPMPPPAPRSRASR